MKEEIEALSDRLDELARDVRRFAGTEPDTLAGELDAVLGIDDPAQIVAHVRGLAAAIRKIREVFDLDPDTESEATAETVRAFVVGVYASIPRVDSPDDALARVRDLCEADVKLDVANARIEELTDESAGAAALEPLRELLATLRPIFGVGLALESEPEFADVRLVMLDAEKALSAIDNPWVAPAPAPPPKKGRK